MHYRPGSSCCIRCVWLRRRDLVVYRGSYAAFDRHISWRAPAIGVLIAAVWFLFAHFLIPRRRNLRHWGLYPRLSCCLDSCTHVAATVTVPIAEELAYADISYGVWSTPDFNP